MGNVVLSSKPIAMASSLLKTVGAAAVAIAANTGATKSYQVSEVYNSTNFFDKFNFFSGTDPNGGYVQYQTQANAQDLGLVKTQDDEVYVGVDIAGSYQATGAGRKSVRLESKNVYNKGLIIAEFTHLPKPVCGSWPAFWFFGDPWPTKGEIDLYENWNDLNFNRHTSHVDKPDVVGDCTLVASDMTAKIDSPNCYDFADGQANFQGCSASEISSTFGSPSGGIFALEWTDDFLKIWDWPRDGAPKDISSGQPAPGSAWGQPSYVISKCNVDKAFKDMKMVLNVNFCGVAGQTGQWDTSCKATTGFGTCNEYVAAKGGDFESSNFKVKDIKVYELKEGQAQVSTSSTASSPSSTSAAPSSATSVSTESTTASVSTQSDGPGASVTTTSSASQNTATSTASEDDDSCTDENGETSSSSVVSPTVSVSVTTTEQEMTTSTIYSTDIHTVTSCASTVTDCPAGSYVTTKIISVGTTVCPVTKSEGSKTEPTPTSSAPAEYTTSVVEVTNTYTVTSCAATVTNCPVGAVTSEVTLTTTVCPVSKESPSATPSSSKPAETPGTISKPAESTATETGVVSTPSPTTASSSGSTTITNGGSYVVVTPTVVLSSSINLGYNGTITTSFTTPGGAASTGAAGCKGANCVVPVAGSVKTSVSFTLMGVAAFFFLAL
ncbi:glycoside hydrolase family 16 protein [Daldinia decipiens]|uniref:glycoside hydrolase family 16 protein n=1 Tax=Daldinia decipiens TaxID=326647 RepID=UPI0020C2B03D|nr:glycoside hydrolase family 16 protein [Daldinia decipiens]KAI1662647.1 glycoside hydrolase family 16 protein [Daldinia decipiens]